MKKKTIYHLIVDKSGSMNDCIDNTIQGFNEQVARIRQLEEKFSEQEITIGLTTFNDEVTHQFFRVSPENVKELTREIYRPCGSTALLDAIGLTAGRLEEMADISNPENGTTAVVVILTDGYENSSGMYNLRDIRNLVTRLEANGKWTFSFIGATLDAVDVAETMAIKRQNSMSFVKEQMREGVWDKLSSSVDRYLNQKCLGQNTGDFLGQ